MKKKNMIQQRKKGTKWNAIEINHFELLAYLTCHLLKSSIDSISPLRKNCWRQNETIFRNKNQWDIYFIKLLLNNKISKICDHIASMNEIILRLQKCQMRFNNLCITTHKNYLVWIGYTKNVPVHASHANLISRATLKRLDMCLL